ncbi:hypothetical protein [Halalkalibacter nanhaiisediminis]|uniref:Uncharacterized protein n=1 Tax=Halalkalibacter nanhaiisediminis TaxID=688079 RepID=A0A562QMC4_9BACI|nr:hypothetical protein [Halalkalibacter nanhaiisediminis]TWI57845.1 hypothetical protein IQ10_01174 [Halalkalibacter nanhaiisediminis]
MKKRIQAIVKGGTVSINTFPMMKLPEKKIIERVRIKKDVKNAK